MLGEPSNAEDIGGVLLVTNGDLLVSTATRQERVENVSCFVKVDRLGVAPSPSGGKNEVIIVTSGGEPTPAMQASISVRSI